MSDIVWSDPEWLQYFPLNKLSALDYFARSAFYDPSCNNEILRQRGLDISRLPTLPPGVEFVLHDMQEPHLYIICKQQRKSPKDAEPLAFYDILDGRIYQMPAIHAALSSRMSRCLYNVKAAFQSIQEDIDPLQKICLEGGGSHALASEVTLTDVQIQKNKEESERARQVDGILFNVLNTHSSLLPHRQNQMTEPIKAEEPAA